MPCSSINHDKTRLCKMLYHQALTNKHHALFVYIILSQAFPVYEQKRRQNNQYVSGRFKLSWWFSDWAAAWQNQNHDMCAQGGLTSDWAIQSSHEETLDPKLLLSAHGRLWSDCADTQADLSLCWAHMSFFGFVNSPIGKSDMSAAKISQKLSHSINLLLPCNTGN